jgi:hypothetical protein
MTVSSIPGAASQIVLREWKGAHIVDIDGDVYSQLQEADRMDRAKETKSKNELEAIIFERCHQAGMKQLESVEVLPRDGGWQATYTAPMLLIVLYSPEFAEIVQIVRDEFDLSN